MLLPLPSFPFDIHIGSKTCLLSQLPFCFSVTLTQQTYVLFCWAILNLLILAVISFYLHTYPYYCCNFSMRNVLKIVIRPLKGEESLDQTIR